jgi:hypothetical protein
MLSLTLLTGGSLYWRRYVIPVRYELNVYILFRINSAFKSYIHSETAVRHLTGRSLDRSVSNCCLSVGN